LERSPASVGNDPAGRNLSTFPDDTFIVSYPKSGNTWTRFLVASLIHDEEPMTFLKADKVIPTVDSQSRKYFKSLPRPRVIKSHFPFDQNYPRVIYIVRDPKDVAVPVSLPDQAQGSRRRPPIDEWIPRYVAGETCPYGSWGENVGSWLAARQQSPNFVLLRYEDMIQRTDVELIKIARFLDIDPTPERIQWAIGQSTADRMRKLEQKEAGNGSPPRIPARTSSSFAALRPERARQRSRPQPSRRSSRPGPANAVARL